MASDGTTKMWTGNATYQNDIFGIGKDLAGSGLEQRISKSVNTGALLTLSTDANFTDINTSHASVGAVDKSFLMMGDNAASTAYSVVITIPASLSIYPSLRVMSRIWNVQRTNTIDAVNIKSTPAADYLIVSSDATFDATDLWFPLTNGEVLTGTMDILGTSSFNAAMTNGKFVTLAKITTSPGGVGTSSGLSRWFKADLGYTPGTTATWENQVGGNDLSQSTAARQPVFSKSVLSNYNPTLSFDGTVSANADRLQGSDAGLPTGSASRNAFAITTSAINTGSRSVVGYGTNSINDLFYMSASGANSWVRNFSNDFTTSDGKIIPASGTILMMQGNRTPNIHIASTYGGTILTNTASNFTTALNGAVAFNIGLNNANGNPWTGQINEVVMYNADLATAERKKVESYLAIKYGVTLDPSALTYVNSVGTTTYDIDATYKNQIIGIGFDRPSGLRQAQSHTSDDSLRLYVGSLAATNEDNLADITNDFSSIVIGHDGGLLIAKSPISPEKPAGIYSRIDREWKVTNTNFSNDFSLEFKWKGTNASINLADLRLLVDDDGDFSNATIIAAPTVTFTLGSIIVSGISTSVIPMNSTKYITIASASATTPLPISLLSFTATKNSNQTATLNWQTAQEINSKNFVVLRSADGNNWQPIGQAAAAGNSSSTKSYRFIDNSPATGTNYYRLQSTDKDGSFTYSEVRVLKFEAGNNKITVIPNPVRDKVYVNSNTAIKQVILFNAAGKLVWQTDNFTRGSSIDMAAYSKGVYVLKLISTDGTSETHKIIKQ